MDFTLEEYKELFFQQLGSVALFDAHGRYVAVNEGWRKKYAAEGKALTSLEGHDVLEFIPSSLVHDVIRTKKPISGMGFWPKIGESDYLVGNYLPLFKNGELIGVAMYSIFNNSKEAQAFYADMQKTRSQLEYYQREVTQMQRTRYTIDSIIGTSALIKNLKLQISKAARTSSIVLIEGETGSGKELVAQSIHNLSERRNSAFVRLNCATIPPGLAESELFGYEGGSFTGAEKRGKIGKFEAANNGSIFLDEINSLALDIQPKLLRVLQEHEVEHVGSTRSIPINTRVIASTNTPLQELVNSGLFRQDLFYRLNVFNIRVPSLKERKEDIPLLAKAFIESLNESLGTEIEQISDEALNLFSLYDWPGNVRELRNVIERAMSWKIKGVLWPKDFLDYFATHSPVPIADHLEDPNSLTSLLQLDYRTAMEGFEQLYFREVLAKNPGNKKTAAAHVGLSRAMFYRKLDKFGLK